MLQIAQASSILRLTGNSEIFSLPATPMVCCCHHLSQLNPNSTPDLSQLNPNSTLNLSQFNPNFTPDLSQLNPNSIPNLSHLNPNSTPNLSQPTYLSDRKRTNHSARQTNIIFQSGNVHIWRLSWKLSNKDLSEEMQLKALVMKSDASSEWTIIQLYTYTSIISFTSTIVYYFFILILIVKYLEVVAFSSVVVLLPYRAPWKGLLIRPLDKGSRHGF